MPVSNNQEIVSYTAAQLDTLLASIPVPDSNMSHFLRGDGTWSGIDGGTP